ncbi:type II secretion system GspH family protein [Rickettsiales bacterium]|nr:type II secretion system GspH family protein [Rickettsiales bacterium]
MKKKNSGFTLIELSIVIVIMGLILAGIFTGQDIIKQAKLRDIITDINKYSSALSAFNLEYNALPGDFNNATAFWTSCTDNGGKNSSCNGDGDRKIEWSESSTKEGFRAWQHLSLAELIEGSYAGYANAADSSQATIGVDVPASSYEDIGYSFDYLYEMNVMQIGSATPNAEDGTAWNTNKTGLYPLDVETIDRKIDDGNGDSGILISRGTNCDSSGVYAVTTESKVCAIDYKLQFK